MRPPHQVGAPWESFSRVSGQAWRDEDWEVAAEREATARLATGDAEGALEVLAQRRQRTAGSRLHRLAIEALARQALDAAALETVLVSSDERQLRHDQALTRRVLSALAPHSAPVLRKMAATFGNRSDQEVIRRDAFKLEDLLKQVGTTTVGAR